MNINKRSYFVLSVKLSDGTLNVHESVDELVNKIADSVESVSIAKYSDRSDESEENVFSCNTKEEYKEIIKKLEGSTVICPTPLSRIALLHALNKWGLTLKCNWASGARIIRRYRYDYKGILPKDLNGYDLNHIFEEFLGKDSMRREGSDTASNYVKVLKGVSKKSAKDINELIKDSQEELLKKDGTGPVPAKKLIITRNDNPHGLFWGKIIIPSNYKGRTAKDCYKKQAAHWAAGLGFEIKNGSIGKKNPENKLLVTLAEKKDGDPDTQKMKDAKKLGIPHWQPRVCRQINLAQRTSDLIEMAAIKDVAFLA